VAFPQPAEGSTALVTGASSGIGAAIANELAARGFSLTLTARREERLRTICGSLSERHGVRAEHLTCDLADDGERERLADRIEGWGLTVEVLVNNAGFGTHSPFSSTPRERHQQMVRLNVEAVVDLSSRFLPAMIERGRGGVLNVASTAAFQPLPNEATYAATKAFVLSHSEALHAEAKPAGVTVTALCPGPVRTEFADVAGFEGIEDRTPGLVWMSAEEVARHGVRGLERGRRVVVPGPINQAGAIAGQHAPRAALLPLMKRFWGRL
jgi:short-subunit dehydrogenase